MFVQDDPEPLFDVEKVDEIEQTRQLLADEGIGLSYDEVKGFNIFGAIGQLFRSGDGRRYSILNLAYQLSCYQVDIFKKSEQLLLSTLEVYENDHFL